MGAHLEEAGVGVKPYEGLLEDVRALAASGATIWADPAKARAASLESFSTSVLLNSSCAGQHTIYIDLGVGLEMVVLSVLNAIQAMTLPLRQ